MLEPEDEVTRDDAMVVIVLEASVALGLDVGRGSTVVVVGNDCAELGVICCVVVEGA